MDNHFTQNTTGVSQGAASHMTAGNDIIINNNPSYALPAVTAPAAGTSTSVSTTHFRYHIPIPTRHFKGQGKALEAINGFFTNQAPQTDDWVERTVVITGLGGMGKTETACKFAQKNTFPNVAFINAETANSTLTSFLGLANELGINLKGKQGSDIAQAVYSHIDQHYSGQVLFIFDNVIQLNSDEAEIGIIKYLPTAELINKRYPYVLITTQTQDWDRGMRTIQIEELSTEESVEFFRSTFKIESAECDDLFKELHDHLDGFPLAMILTASLMDYNPYNGPVHKLKQEIRSFIDKLKEEELVNAKINPAYPTKYTKTLANVWKLTFRRIQKEEHGREALKLLQLMSFLHVPFWSSDVVEMLIHSSVYPHLSKTELELRLNTLPRVLERFYAVRILNMGWYNDGRSCCQLGIHRLVQLVVRQQMNSSKIFERVLLYFARHYKTSLLNKSALKEAILTRQLSQKALTYVGILACHGFPAAREIVMTKKPETETKADDIIWNLYSLERGRKSLGEKAIKVLGELIGLARSEECNVEERCFFADITIRLLTDQNYFEYSRDNGSNVPGYYNLENLKGLEELITQLILDDSKTFNWAQHSNCSYCCENGREPKDKLLSAITVKLSKTFVQVESSVTVGDIKKIWFALFARMRCYRWPEFICQFWREIYNAFQSPDKETRSRIVALRTHLWSSGLAWKLSDMLDFIGVCYSLNSCTHRPFFFELMGVSIDGMDLLDDRVKQVLSSFCEMIKSIEKKFSSKDHKDVTADWFVVTVDLCSVWIKLFLMNSDPLSQQLLESHLSRLKFLDWMERSPEFTRFQRPYFDGLNRIYPRELSGFRRPNFRAAVKLLPEECRSQYFPQFIEKFSSSEIKVIQTLRNFCKLVV